MPIEIRASGARDQIGIVFPLFTEQFRAGLHKPREMSLREAVAGVSRYN